ncbi:MAG: DNA starvation/stationary phase protection protein [Pseudomonadota bacterium]
MSEHANDSLAVVNALSQSLADSYVIRLKTQAVHWNVEGPHFLTVHNLTEEHYEELADAIDEIAERIRAIGEKAPASYAKYSDLKGIDDAEPSGDALAMVATLRDDHQTVSKRLAGFIETAGEAGDSVSEDLLINRKEFHDKAAWMLRSIAS